MQIGIWQILVVAIVVLVLFGRGRISEMMGDFGKGISSFKKGMSEEVDGDSKTPPPAPKQIEGPRHGAKPASETNGEPKPTSSADKNA